MKYIKYFENNSIVQQPFYLRGDMLYISDELAKSITKFKLTKKDKNISWAEHVIKNNYEFYKNAELGHKSNVNYALTDDLWIRYDNNSFRMNIIIYKGVTYDNEAGHFKYFIGGNSGDYSMHGKNMKRATRDCNLNFMIHFYPIVGHIKDFYKKLKNERNSNLQKQPFFDIIKEAIKKDNSIVQYGVPDELINDNDVGHFIGGYKYNL